MSRETAMARCRLLLRAMERFGTKDLPVECYLDLHEEDDQIIAMIGAWMEATRNHICNYIEYFARGVKADPRWPWESLIRRLREEEDIHGEHERTET